MYLNQRIRRRQRSAQPMGSWWEDIINSVTGGQSSGGTDPNAPVIDVTGSGETVDTGPVVQVSTIGGQVSSIPSSQAGGGYTTIGGFVSTNGICKPTDSTSLGKFKELQRQANRVADAIGATKIGVDGAIGPGTLALMSTIKTKAQASDTGSQGWGNFLANQNTSSCTAVAGGTDNLIPMLSAMADALGVSSSVASPAPASPPQIYNPITGQVSNQGIAADLEDLLGNMSTTTKIAALGIAGGIGYFLYKDSKKGRRK